jgi:transketolase
MTTSESISALKNIATELRIDSIESTTEAGSGHPTSCMSAAEIVATVFFGEMRFDPMNPQNPDNDRFVLSKGHAAPILYAAWAHTGLFPRKDLLKLRRFDSDLEGHPTPRLPFVDVATGSLGQGICAAVGTALNARRIGSDYRTYALLGDGEMAEGSVWEAADVALYHKLDNLCGIVDVNALGQSRHTQFDHRMDEIAARWNAFGWHTLIVDGHDVEALLHAFAAARAAKNNPTMILARTIKGKGVASVEGKDGWHGKAFKKGEEADRAIAELRTQLSGSTPNPRIPPPASKPREAVKPDTSPDFSKMPAPSYKPGEQVATREAWGTALAALGAVDRRVVALDADVKNSTFSDRFEKTFPDRFYQNFIAEQVMVGAAMGLAARGAIAFATTFACFLTRAADFIRMSGLSNARHQLNVKLTGSHAGVSIGEDGPSQMALEDLAIMRAVPDCAVIYPCDAVSTERLVVEMAHYHGLAYMRTSRPKTDIIYGLDETFPIGGSKVIRQSASDVATVVGVGVTVFEALKAYDQLKAQGINIRVIDA